MSDIPYYEDYIPESLLRDLLVSSQDFSGVEGLRHIGKSGGLENTESMTFLVELYLKLKHPLNLVLTQRAKDRRFIDERVKVLTQYNIDFNHDYLSCDYKMVLGLEDADGRIVFGPKRDDYVKKGGSSIAPLPDHLRGPHVTLFGPPDSTKLSINAMNAFHRQLKGEPKIVSELLKDISHAPKWGADDEDSKTPLRADLISAGVNLSGCFNRDLSLTETEKSYQLASDKLSLPIKRFPGLALPCTFLFYHNSPIPLHLYDFVMHLFAHHNKPEALTFYVPKLENEEEARYIKLMMQTSEEMIQKINPDYKMGTIRLMIVLENPRAIFRTHEIMDELYPYFAGASLGWHDYLASTARLFKEDSHYRIPVKADPDIVIKYIKASHRLLADVVGPRGGIKVGGMYGILPQNTDIESDSFQLTLKGYIKDVVTQMKRSLTGFWVAHPDFVRLGLGMVEAWRRFEAGSQKELQELVYSLLRENFAHETWRFIEGNDIAGLDVDDPLYARSLIVADLKESDYIANNHPDEIRYNVFQCLQYLADWLTGNGCVALPAQIDGIAVRVMDDLATTERSRWEVWSEIYHKRFPLEDFLTIAHEELNFIRKDLSDQKKIVQVKWDDRTAKWYPIAFKLMIKLMTEARPVEFATELLMPFTVEAVREREEPLEYLASLSEKFQLDPYVARFNHYFEALGSKHFATAMAKGFYFNDELAREIVESFSIQDIIYASSFHGDIGEGKKTLDAHAQKEQAKVFNAHDDLKLKLASSGLEYIKKHGFKFLVSAKDKSADELLRLLEERLKRDQSLEASEAKKQLLIIAQKRLGSSQPRFLSHQNVCEINQAQISVFNPQGERHFFQNCSKKTLFQVASLSKSVASAFSIEFFKSHGIELTSKVNSVLKKFGSTWMIPEGDEVEIQHLMNHQALNMHYMMGIPLDQVMPGVEELLEGNSVFGYEKIKLTNPAGEKFQYSGAGFIVLEYLVKLISKKSIPDLTRSFLDSLGMQDFSFEQKNSAGFDYAKAQTDSPLKSERLMFPAFAAGAMGTAQSMGAFLKALSSAYEDPSVTHPISYHTARFMLHGSDKGCKEFMGCLIGLGVFIVEAGENKLALHQGANDGFRALYLYCFAGPDKGKGLVSLSTGDFKGVLFNAYVAQDVLRDLNFSGIDYSQFQSGFEAKNLKPEEIVNIGYRDLVMKAMQPTLPEKIVVTGPRSPLADFNLATKAKIVSVTNQLFARAENLLSPFEPVFDPELFGKQGKIMDSWETVRHNPSFDELIIELSEVSFIRYIDLSTKYHTGNHTPKISLCGKVSGEWREIFPPQGMEGHSLLSLDLEDQAAEFKFLRIRVYPDGGLTRLGVYNDLPETVKPLYSSVKVAKPKPFTDKVPQTKKPMSLHFEAHPKEIQKNKIDFKNKNIDLASSAFGGEVLRVTNQHYGPATHVISPYAPLNMFDGFETARNRNPLNVEEVEMRIAPHRFLHSIELDFTYFVNNNPREIALQIKQGESWIELVQKQSVKPFAGSRLIIPINRKIEGDIVKIQAYPCGGFNRVHIYGELL